MNVQPKVNKMQNPIFTNLFEHWSALRQGIDVPGRSEIDPRIFPDALENTFIFERIAKGDYRIRLAGMNLCDMMGMEVRGQSAASFMRQSERFALQQVLEHILTRPAVGELALVATDIMGKDINLNMILLPLRSDTGEINRIIGCISYPQSTFAAPLRFSIQSKKLTPTSTLDQRAGDRAAGFSENSAAFDLSEVQTATETRNPARTPKKSGHLKLIKDT